MTKDKKIQLDVDELWRIVHALELRIGRLEGQLVRAQRATKNPRLRFHPDAIRWEIGYTFGLLQDMRSHVIGTEEPDVPGRPKPTAPGVGDDTGT